MVASRGRPGSGRPAMCAATPSFAVDSLQAEARERTGLSDFGDPDFLEPLAVLAQSLDREANLHAVGRATQAERLVESLCVRLRLEQAWKTEPAIARERIDDPLVIIGLPRSGTTWLHRLLATDPALTAVLWWECRSPAPWPDSDWRRGGEPRIPDAHAQVKAILEAQPELAAIHPWDPEGPDEEILLLEHSFRSHVPESGADLPSYRAWLDHADLMPGYRFLQRLLRYLQWQKRVSGRLGERWVLKAPFHLGYLDVLFAVFPGAQVIHAHRDPVATLPSIASMYRSLWSLATEPVDPEEIGRQCLARFTGALTRCLEARDRLPRDRFLDVAYADVMQDPVAEVRRIRNFAGRELGPEAEAALLRFVEGHARDTRPAHEYTPREFGYTSEGLARDFAAYRERFIGSRAP